MTQQQLSKIEGIREKLEQVDHREIPSQMGALIIAIGALTDLVEGLLQKEQESNGEIMTESLSGATGEVNDQSRETPATQEFWTYSCPHCGQTFEECLEPLYLGDNNSILPRHKP